MNTENDIQPTCFTVDDIFTWSLKFKTIKTKQRFSTNTFIMILHLQYVFSFIYNWHILQGTTIYSLNNNNPYHMLIKIV